MRLVSALLLSTVALAQWPQWRGPQRDGSVAPAPVKWPAHLKPLWKTAVGNGYSSPVLDGRQLYVHTRRADDEVVSQIDAASGKILWQKAYPAPFKQNQYAMQQPKGPFSTPLVHAGRLYTYGVSGALSCWNIKDGALVWRREWPGDTSKLFTGTAMSPIIEGGLLIVHVGDDRGGSVLALDPATGRERWEWKGDGPGYASPVAGTFGGLRQIVTITDRSVIALEAASGKLLWSLSWKDEWNENIPTPLIVRDTVVLSGVRKPTTAVRPRLSDGKWTAEEVWRNADVSMYMSSPVLDGGRVCGLSAKQKGQFFCLDGATGKTVWTTAGRTAEQAALLSAGNFLLLLTNDGILTVARKHAPAMEQVVRYKVAESATFSHPVVTATRVFVKDADTLHAWSVE
jgi:outer membrane protein assembly factor BamB